LLAVRILSRGIVFTHETGAAGAHGCFSSHLVGAPVTPLTIERAIPLNVIVDDATTFTVRTGGVGHRDDIAILDADAVVLGSGIPLKLIDVAARDHFHCAFVGGAIRIGPGDVVFAGDVRLGSGCGTLAVVLAVGSRR